MKKNLTRFQKLIFRINQLAFLGLIITIISYYLPSKNFPWLTIFGLGFPFIAIINFFFVLYWLFKRKKALLLSTIGLLIGAPQISASIQFSAENKSFEPNEKIRVMTYNVRGFDKYHWLYKDHQSEKYTTYFEVYKPDILCFQENSVTGYSPQIPLKHRYISNTNSGKISLAIYSQYPIINKGKVDFTEKIGPYGYFIFADLLRGKDTIRVYNAHLISNYLNPADYKAIRDLDTDKKEEIKAGIKDILRRLTIGAKSRSSQLKDLDNHLKTAPQKVIFCMDMNSTPTTHAYYTMKKYFRDAFIDSGKGLGNTFRRIPVPLRIDHIFYSEDFRSYNYRVSNFPYSDHYPVVADLVLSDPS